MGIPPLPDPEWLQAGALAGALDSPGGGTLDFFDFFRFLAFSKKIKKIKKFLLIFFDFFRFLAFSKKIKKINKMKKTRDPGSPRVEGFWPWESLLSRILSGSRLEPWLEPLTLPAGAPWIFLIFFVFWPFRKNQKNFIDFFHFFRLLAFSKKIQKINIFF